MCFTVQLVKGLANYNNNKSQFIAQRIDQCHIAFIC